METSARIFFSSSALNRQSPSSALVRGLALRPSRRVSNSPSRRRHITLPPRIPLLPNNRLAAVAPSTYCSARFRSSSFPPSPIRNSNQLGAFSSLSALHASNYLVSDGHFAPFLSDLNGKYFEWNLASEGSKGGEEFVDDKRPIVTAVLLGWLGAKPKHMRRYVELYNSRGIHAVTFVVSVRNVLSFDLEKKLEHRISVLADELASWLEKEEKDGRKRVLLFHTFSNTGWLAYGGILENFKSRQDLLEKIKGCVVDSGGDPHINPKVWAAGFAAALLKKHSYSAYPSPVVGEGLSSELNPSKTELKEPLLIEILLLVAFEKLFSFLFNLPNVQQRLTKIISALEKNQLPCPQLYLYSTADKVIPSHSVEEFIDEQKKQGREVWSFNFGTSPHVDHYRTFPDIYSSQLHYFLKKCLPTKVAA